MRYEDMRAMTLEEIANLYGSAAQNMKPGDYPALMIEGMANSPEAKAWNAMTAEARGKR